MTRRRVALSFLGVLGTTAFGAAAGFASQVVLNQQGWLLFGTLAGFVGGGFWLAMADPRK